MVIELFEFTRLIRILGFNKKKALKCQSVLLPFFWLFFQASKNAKFELNGGDIINAHSMVVLPCLNRYVFRDKIDHRTHG